MLDRETIAERIIKFAQDNNLKIHPGQEPLKWADLLIKRKVNIAHHVIIIIPACMFSKKMYDMLLYQHI